MDRCDVSGATTYPSANPKRCKHDARLVGGARSNASGKPQAICRPCLIRHIAGTTDPLREQRHHVVYRAR